MSDTPSLSGKSLLLIFATALVIRIALMLILQSWEIESEWAYGHEMGRIGQWLAEGRGFTLDGKSPSAKFPPVYPFVTAAAFSIFGVYSKAGAVALFLFQSVCAAVTAVCLAVLGNRLVGRSVGLIASVVWAFYPISIFRSIIRIWYSELAAMLCLIIIIAATSKHSPTFRRIALFGGLSGLLVLVDSTLVLCLVLLLFWSLLTRGVKF